MSAGMALRIELDYEPQTATVGVIGQYFSKVWATYIGVDQDFTTHGSFHIGLPTSNFWTPDSLPDVTPTDPYGCAVEHLEKSELDYVVLNPGTAAGISAMNTVDLAVEWARATNDWTCEQWLARDERFRGSIVIAPQDADAAAAEIRRVGTNRQMVQIVLAYPRSFLGVRGYKPIHEAAAELGLAINLQGGASYTGVNRGYAGYGHPESMLEYKMSSLYGAQAHLTSMIAQGVFENHPELRLILNGFGVAWLPSIVWGFDTLGGTASYGQRPLRHSAQEYVSSRVMLGTGAIELPANPSELGQLLQLVDGGRLLVASAKSPIDEILAAVPADWHDDLLGGNARRALNLAR
jgi:predicted TIM-barrel fold metal-dependent hydrolase